jgi:membrane associated rhomboid family serine protease
MTLSPVSLLALAAMLAAVGVAWSRRFIATGSLAIGNVAVFLLTAFGPTVRIGTDLLSVVQAELGLWSPNIVHEPSLAALQLFTSMFVHADLWHLFGNLLVLLAFALPFEERIGARRFVLIYLASGAVAALAQVAVDPSPSLLLGASGAVFGIIGAFAASYPNLIVPLPLPLPFIMLFVRMRVWLGAVVFGALEVLIVQFAMPGDNVAHFAHLGGLVSGAAFALLLVRGNAPAERRPVAVDLGALAPFARDAGTAQALTQMRTNHDEPQIFQAWLDRFFRTATCPQCGHKVMPRHHGEIVCTQGHRFDVRQDQRKPIAA